MVRALNVLPPPAPSPSDRRRPHDPVLEQGQPAVSHPPQPPGDLTAAGDIVPEPLQQSGNASNKQTKKSLCEIASA